MMGFVAARALATTMIDFLAPATEAISVAGDVRRQRPLVQALVIVAAPKHGPGQVNLWGETVGAPDLLAARMDEAVAAGLLERRYDPKGRTVWGPHFYQGWSGKVAVNVIATAPRGFATALFHHTGPPVYVREAYRASGAALVSDGGLVLHDGRVVYAEDEEEVFTLLGLHWLPPIRRGRG